MPSQDEIYSQQEILAAHRRHLALLLQQLAIHGKANVPPAIYFGIANAREEIQRIKKTLREWGVIVEDLDDDEEKPLTKFLNNTFVNMLYVSASPFWNLNIDASKIGKAIQSILGRSVFESNFKFYEEENVRFSDMPTLLRKYTPDIVHFNVAASPNIGLYFDDSKRPGERIDIELAYSGSLSTHATIPALAELFNTFSPNTVCAVFVTPISRTDARILAQEVKVVIGFDNFLYLEEAQVFTEGFYEGLGMGKGLQRAFEFGKGRLKRKNRVFIEHINTIDPSTIIKLG